MLLEQRPPLAFGHAAPNTELHLVVERLGEALGDDRAVLANSSRFPLRRSTNEEFVGIDGTTPRLRHPRHVGFGRTTARTMVRNRTVVTEAVAFRCCGRDCGDRAARVHQILTWQCRHPLPSPTSLLHDAADSRARPMLRIPCGPCNSQGRTHSETSSNYRCTNHG